MPHNVDRRSAQQPRTRRQCVEGEGSGCGDVWAGARGGVDGGRPGGPGAGAARGRGRGGRGAGALRWLWAGVERLSNKLQVMIPKTATGPADDRIMR